MGAGGDMSAQSLHGIAPPRGRGVGRNRKLFADLLESQVAPDLQDHDLALLVGEKLERIGERGEARRLAMRVVPNLPRALASDFDVRVLIPGYRQVLEKHGPIPVVARLEGVGDVPDMLSRVAALKPGETAVILLQRNGQSMEVRVTPGTRPVRR